MSGKRLISTLRNIHLSSTRLIKTKDRYEKHQSSIRQVESEDHLKDHVQEEKEISENVFTYGGAVKVTEDMMKKKPIFVEDCQLNYEQIPIAHIKSTSNNTIVTVKDGNSENVFIQSSCGCLGFKNARKGTSVAAQTLGTYVGQQLLRRKQNYLRIVMKGLGIGRLASVKAISMTGVKIVSLTDNMFIQTETMRYERPKKVRRV